MVTLCRNMGIEIDTTPVPGMTGRPNCLVQEHEPIRALRSASAARTTPFSLTRSVE